MISSRRLTIALVFVFFLVVLLHLQSLHRGSTHVPLFVDKSPSSSNSAGPDNLSKIVIIASTKEEDMKWIKEEIPDITTAIYIVDDENAEFKVPINKGREGMVYLTYLIDHYATLPDVMVFIHAHKLAWHNNDLFGSSSAEMLRALSAPHVKRSGYFNLRCHWDPGCPDWMHPFDPSNRTDISKPEERELAEAFKQIFPDRQVPETMATPCCAQFALSKEAVRSVPLEQLIAYRQWLISTPLHDLISGRVWEYLWHYVFTDFTPVVCPPMDQCYCDGFGVCFGGDEAYKNFTNKWDDMRMMQISLSSWEKEYKEEEKEMSKAASGVKEQLQRKIKEVEKDVWAVVAQAKLRGQDPGLRATDSKRKWRPGDGF